MEHKLQKGIFNVAKGYNNFVFRLLKSITFKTNLFTTNTTETFSSTIGELADRRKIQSDYKKIGNDMRRAIERYERSEL